jgi:predicted metal-dependent peptidase
MVDKNAVLAKISKTLILEQPFYGLFLISLNKVWEDRIETAGVSINGINYMLYINPEFFLNLPDNQKKGVLIHELIHIAFNHLVMRDKFQDKKLFNIAADCELNQYIDRNDLPEGAIYPDSFPELNLPLKAGTHKYYELLQSAAENNESETLSNMLESDMHPTWEDITAGLSDAEKKLIEKQLKHQLNEVASSLKNKGDIPGFIKEVIDNMNYDEPSKFDWKSYLRRFAGNSNKIYTRKSRRKENHRLEGNPAIQIKMRNHILVAIDTSGSVSTSELKEFLQEIYHINKTGTVITVVQCDTEINSIEPFNHRKEIKFKGRGGTEFQPVIDHFNENKGKYTSLIYFTDGECSAPRNVNFKTLWVHSSKSTINNDLPGFKIQLN